MDQHSKSRELGEFPRSGAPPRFAEEVAARKMKREFDRAAKLVLKAAKMLNDSRPDKKTKRYRRRIDELALGITNLMGPAPPHPAVRVAKSVSGLNRQGRPRYQNTPRSHDM